MGVPNFQTNSKVGIIQFEGAQMMVWWKLMFGAYSAYIKCIQMPFAIDVCLQTHTHLHTHTHSYVDSSPEFFNDSPDVPTFNDSMKISRGTHLLVTSHRVHWAIANPLGFKWATCVARQLDGPGFDVIGWGNWLPARAAKTSWNSDMMWRNLRRTGWATLGNWATGAVAMLISWAIPWSLVWLMGS